MMLPSLLLEKFAITSISGKDFWKHFNSDFQDFFPPELYFSERSLVTAEQAEKSATLDS